MNKQFLIGDDDGVSINEEEVSKSTMNIWGRGLPSHFAQEADERAEALECRLQRIEAALGFSESPEHTAALKSAIDKL